MSQHRTEQKASDIVKTFECEGLLRGIVVVQSIYSESSLSMYILTGLSLYKLVMGRTSPARPVTDHVRWLRTRKVYKLLNMSSSVNILDYFVTRKKNARA